MGGGGWCCYKVGIVVCVWGGGEVLLQDWYCCVCVGGGGVAATRLVLLCVCVCVGGGVAATRLVLLCVCVWGGCCYQVGIVVGGGGGGGSGVAAARLVLLRQNSFPFRQLPKESFALQLRACCTEKQQDFCIDLQLGALTAVSNERRLKSSEANLAKSTVIG